MSGYESIRSTIEQFPQGRIFFPDEFNSIGSGDTIRSALVRLCGNKFIIRLGQGIYCYPKIDDKWGAGVLYPSVDDIARAIAERDHCRIAPTGSYALNALGLSTQLQTNVVYYTDGSPRRISIGNGRGILFKRSSEMKRFAFNSQLMQLIVAALREIGNGNITDEKKRIVADHLKNVGDTDFTHDVALAPEWVRNLLKELK